MSSKTNADASNWTWLLTQCQHADIAPDQLVEMWSAKPKVMTTNSVWQMRRAHSLGRTIGVCLAVCKYSNVHKLVWDAYGVRIRPMTTSTLFMLNHADDSCTPLYSVKEFLARGELYDFESVQAFTDNEILFFTEQLNTVEGLNGVVGAIENRRV